MALRGPRFLVVVCDPICPSGLVGRTILSAGGFYDTILPAERFASFSPASYPGLPSAPGGYAGLVILGGRMSANDEADYPHFRELAALARRFEEQGRLVLGICLGAQILARAHGARVFRLARLEAGFVDMDVTDEGVHDPVLAHLGRRCTFFQFHSEAFDLPPAGRLLVSGGAGDVQAFRIGDASYGLQFHLEVSLDAIREWIRLFGESLQHECPDLLKGFDERLAPHLEPQRRAATEILQRWIALAPWSSLASGREAATRGADGGAAQ